MLINKIKNFIIIFFVLLAVYQTGMLWFENFSSRSFFYSLFSDDNKPVRYEDIRYTLNNIMIGTGGNEFIKKGSNIYESEYKVIFDTAVKECIDNGKYNGEINLNSNEILKRKCAVYNYDYILDGKDVEKIFGKKISKQKKIGNFDSIIINPDDGISVNMKIIFYSSLENKGYEYEIKNDSIISECYNAINNIEKKEDEIYYISSEKNGLELFAHNVFIPKRQDGNGLNCVTASNMFEEDGSVLLMTLEKNIDNFFDNPAIKWSSTVNDVYTYSDENTVVKYYTTGVIEYSSYKNTMNKTESDFYDSYMTAIGFMANDINIKNEYYLVGYKKEGDKIIFYFNYKINDLPIIMCDELKKKTGMNNMIEVTVSGNNVSKYKRLAYVFEEDNKNKFFTDFNFLNAVDSVINEENNSENKIDDLDFGYEVSEDKAVGLSWFIKMNGKMFTKTAE